MPLYEFECPKWHVSAEIVPIGTHAIDCPFCKQNAETGLEVVRATRIMSATRTTFQHADRKLKL